MNERDTFLRAIDKSWDDPTPILVFADWADEHGTDDPALLRWYGGHVMSALAAVPGKCGRASGGDRDRAGKAVARHPQADALLRAAAVAFCRRPGVWDGPENQLVRPAVGLCRRLILGFAPDADRDSAFRRANNAANALVPPMETAYLGGELAEAARLADQMRAHLLVADLLAERPEVARSSLAHRATVSLPAADVAAERGWQMAVYAALALVPPMVRDTQRDEVEAAREVTTKPLPPMKLPRGKFRRIVVRGRAYGWMPQVAEPWLGGVFAIVVRSADNTGPRLLVRPAPQVVLPGLVARIIADALDGGWRPTEHALPDFPWDGTPYLADPST